MISGPFLDPKVFHSDFIGLLFCVFFGGLVFFVFVSVPGGVPDPIFDEFGSIPVDFATPPMRKPRFSPASPSPGTPKTDPLHVSRLGGEYPQNTVFLTGAPKIDFPIILASICPGLF